VSAYPGEQDMNEETIDRIGRELVAAIEAALAADPRVQACLEQARAAGLGFRVALNRTRAECGPAREEARETAMHAPVAYAVSESDRRFLRSLRIAVDEN